MGRTILHVDMNNCFASIECLHRPALRGRPVAVGGDVTQRHGIILAKNELAKRSGVQTAEAIWQARQKCPELVVVPPNYELYLRFSRMARAIYDEYTDRVEPFGLDESWLDLTGCAGLSGEETAHRIRRRIREELGITVSVGVADNKAFAKLGSDLKKPDAVTVLLPEHYADRVWPLPVSKLLYVGPATTGKLARHGVLTIGDLARCDRDALLRWLGKPGLMLWLYANGLDASPVMQSDQDSVIKSIGNSMTLPRDLTGEEEVKAVFYALAESVARRLRAHGFCARELAIGLRDTGLHWVERQMQLERATDLADELCRGAMILQRGMWQQPLRSIGLRAGRLVPAGTPQQTTLFCSEGRRLRQERLERTVDSLRGRFGSGCIRRAVTLRDASLGLEALDRARSSFGGPPERSGELGAIL